MKNIFICGDSFGCPDPALNFDAWPVRLKDQLGSNYNLINLSINCSSNLLIRLQVEHALTQDPDYLIMMCTSSTRFQGQIKSQVKESKDMLARFRRVGSPDPQEVLRDLACYSLHSLDDSCVFDRHVQKHIRDYHSSLFDLELAIFENKCLIESTLWLLESSKINWCFDQGGFENPSFGNVSKKYFDRWQKYLSRINLWTIASELPKPSARHWHIDDPKIHDQIAQYYHQKILEELK